MTARRARHVRVEKELRRQYIARTPVYLRLDRGLKQVYRNLARAWVYHTTRFDEDIMRLFDKVPWVKEPPGGIRPRSLRGKRCRW
jgi:hypothetical protein